jgi:glucans biosynthesis protein C
MEIIKLTMKQTLTASVIATPGRPIETSVPATSSRSAAGRLLFIDNIRWVMILLVLSMHAAVTYSGLGSWYYNEQSTLSRPELLIFAVYQSFLQSFFMGFLFFIAAYFVPAAYDKKGPARFLRDRAYRLGLPSVLFIFVIQPLTCYYAAGLYDTSHGFWGAYQWYITSGAFLNGTGPLWFCVALLFFCLVYAGWRAIIRPAASPIKPAPFPRAITVLGFIGLITVTTYFVRLYWPKGTAWYNMQFCYFPGYIALFIAGTLAYRRSWFSTLHAAAGRRWGLIAILGGLALWLGIVVAGGAFSGQIHTFDGGRHWQSFAMSFWEAFAGTGISIGCLALFREKFNRQGRWAVFFSVNAFAVYVFHTPILIAITKGMTDLHAEVLLKFLLATVLCIIATYILSAFVFRRIPILKNIL